MDLKNYNNFLSDNEKKTLKLVNDKSNLLTDTLAERKNIFNKTLKTIITEWSIHHQKMLSDSVELVKEMNKPKNYNNYNNWWDFLLKYLGDFMKIITKEDRMIYTGITIIFISILLYLVDSSR